MGGGPDRAGVSGLCATSAKIGGASLWAAGHSNIRAADRKEAESANGATERNAAKPTNGETGSEPNGEADFRTKGATSAAARDTARLSAPYLEGRADNRRGNVVGGRRRGSGARLFPSGAQIIRASGTCISLCQFPGPLSRDRTIP